MSDVTPPLNVTQLNDRLSQVAAEPGIQVARARVVLCTLIVSQLLPDAVAIKGGMGVKLRLGERGARATSDLDVSTRARGEEFEHAWRTDGGRCRRRRASCAATRLRRIVSRSRLPCARRGSTIRDWCVPSV